LFRPAISGGRAAAKDGHRSITEGQEPLIENKEVEPGILLRLFAKMVLAPSILRRVHHKDVERLLADVAIQAGRREVAMNLLGRIATREAKKQQKS
jgi:hypothetical protein